MLGFAEPWLLVLLVLPRVMRWQAAPWHPQTFGMSAHNPATAVTCQQHLLPLLWSMKQNGSE